MPVTKKTSRLIAKKITFETNTIIYDVECEQDIKGMRLGVLVANDDIIKKDLLLLPTLFTKHENQKVVFTTNNVTPQFYQNILNQSISDIEEYRQEINSIYLIDDIVARVIYFS